MTFKMAENKENNIKKHQPEIESSEQEFAQRTFQQAFEIWINPEIKKRKNAGTLPSEFQLQRAQVIMNLDSPIQVRFNDEIKVRMQVRVTKTVNKGDPVYLTDFDKILAIELTDDDPNAAHLTIFNHLGNGSYTLTFNITLRESKSTFKQQKNFLKQQKTA